MKLEMFSHPGKDASNRGISNHQIASCPLLMCFVAGEHNNSNSRNLPKDQEPRMYNPAPLRPPSAKRLRRRLRVPARASKGGLDTVTHMALTASFSLELPSAAGLLFFLRLHALHAAQFSRVAALRALFAARASSAWRNSTPLSAHVVIRALYEAGENEKTVGSSDDGLA